MVHYVETPLGNYLSVETLPQGQNLAPHYVETPLGNYLRFETLPHLVALLATVFSAMLGEIKVVRSHSLG